MTPADWVPRNRARVHAVIAGHVDHGKSSVLGKLLVDTHSLPDGKLERVRKTCERLSRPFEYAFLLDALREEQAQGITIDAARVFFSSRGRDYVFFDTPGHAEFLRNMMSGATRASVAYLVVDASERGKCSLERHVVLPGS